MTNAERYHSGPFKRILMDVPTQTHERLKLLALERKQSMKSLLVELIEHAVSKSKKGK